MSRTLKEIFEDLGKMYQQDVEKKDEDGYAELYGAASDKLLHILEEKGFHPTNIEKLDGYFIFGMGTNSVLHFDVAECPGWRFGVWWKAPESNNQHYLRGDWFAQHKELIDKFKPSASTIGGVVGVNGGDHYLDFNLQCQLEFLRDEPALAFCRDYLDWNYNYKYHSREEAEQAMADYYEQKSLRLEYQIKYNRLYLEGAKAVIAPTLEEHDSLWLRDSGPNWFPRYTLVVYAPAIDPCVTLSLVDDFDGWKEWQKKLEDLDSEASSHNVHICTYTYRSGIVVTNDVLTANEQWQKLI